MTGAEISEYDMWENNDPTYYCLGRFFKISGQTDNADTQGNGDKEFQVIFSEPVKIHTVFLLFPNNDEFVHSRVGNSRLWLGYEATPFSTKLTPVTDYFFDGGFQILDGLHTGDILTVRRNGLAITGQIFYNLSTIRAY